MKRVNKTKNKKDKNTRKQQESITGWWIKMIYQGHDNLRVLKIRNTLAYQNARSYQYAIYLTIGIRYSFLIQAEFGFNIPLEDPMLKVRYLTS